MATWERWTGVLNVKFNKKIIPGITVLLAGMLLSQVCAAENPGQSSLPSPTSADLIFPGKDWVEATPGSQGVDAAKLQEAMDVLQAFTKDGNAITGNSQTVVIRNGRLIWKGSDIDTSHRVYSCSKSIFSSVFGLLVDDGKCTPETRAADILPALKEHYPLITLGQMASFTSGYNVPFGKTVSPFEIRPPLHPPGKALHYSKSSDQLAHLLTLLAGKPLRELFDERIASVIGIPRDSWEWSDAGEVNGLKICGGSGNVSISARQLARFGLLYLAEGRWNDRQIVSREWVRLSTRVQVPADVPPHQKDLWYTVLPGRYGYNWWVNGPDAKGERCWPAAPEHTFAAQGLRNNYCFVIPEWQMVVVSLDTGNGMDARLFNQVFVKLREAVQ